MNRSLVKIFLMLTVMYAWCIDTNVSLAQDLTTYEIIDNESVGLTVTPFEKFGMAVSDIDRNGYPDIFCLRWKSPSYGTPVPGYLVAYTWKFLPSSGSNSKPHPLQISQTTILGTGSPHSNRASGRSRSPHWMKTSETT